LSTNNYWRILQKKFECKRTKEHFRTRFGSDFHLFERFFEPTGELALFVAHPCLINREFPIAKNYADEWSVDYFSLKKYAHHHGELPPELEALSGRIFTEDELAGYSLNRDNLLHELIRTLNLNIDVKYVSDTCSRLGSANGINYYLHYGDRTQLNVVVDSCRIDACGYFSVLFVSYNLDTKSIKPLEKIKIENINDFVSISNDSFVLKKDITISKKTPNQKSTDQENLPNTREQSPTDAHLQKSICDPFQEKWPQGPLMCVKLHEVLVYKDKAYNIRGEVTWGILLKLASGRGDFVSFEEKAIKSRFSRGDAIGLKKFIHPKGVGPNGNRSYRLDS